MKKCKQSKNQSIWDHGVAVKNQFLTIKKLISQNKINDLPDFIKKYKYNIMKYISDVDLISEYCLFHDCGKPYCIEYTDGAYHFPNHAEKSFEIFSKIGKSKVAELIRSDMLIHTIKDEDIDEFIKNNNAIILLIVGLAEIYANAEMFGGKDSTSFKIKYKQICRRGNKICSKLFGDKNAN